MKIFNIFYIQFFSFSFLNKDDHIIPSFGFGDVFTTFFFLFFTFFFTFFFFFSIIYSDKSVFPFYPDKQPIGFKEVLERYKEITPGINMSGPTNFAPLINASVQIVKQTKSVYFF